MMRFGGGKEVALSAWKVGLAATGSLAVTWCASPAFAQGAIRAPVAPVRAADPFNAFSIGIGGGFDHLNAPYAGEAYDDVTTDNFSGTLSGNGGFGTVEIGKDFQFNSFVLGIYGDYSSRSVSDSFSRSFGTLDTQGTLKLDNSHSVVARLGVTTNPQTLLYGLFGYTWEHYAANVSSDSSNYNSTVANSASGETGGVTLGVGAEFLLNGDWSFKGEYRYTRLAIPQVGFVDGNDLQNQLDVGKTDDQVIRFVGSYKIR